jgi:hypothetical protein
LPTSCSVPFDQREHAELADNVTRYRVERLVDRYGIDAKLFDREAEADCPRKIARNDYDPCGDRCPDLKSTLYQSLAQTFVYATVWP